MANRARCRMTIATQDGKSLAGATVYVYQPNTTNPIAETMYDDITGGSPLANPLTADVNSSILFYLDAPKRVDLKVSKAGYADLTIPDVQVMPDAEDILTPTSSLDGARLKPGSVEDSALASPSSPAALGTNNGQEIWQRGTGPFTANNAYCADRWQIILAGTDTISVSKDTTHCKANSKASSGITFTLGNGAGASRYKQRLVIADGYEWLLGQVVSVRLPANVDAANAVRGVVTTDGTGGTSTFSGYHPGDSAYHDLDVVNVAIPADATYIDYGISLEATCTAYLDNVMPIQAPVCCNYVRPHPAEEWERCQRYYEVIGGVQYGIPQVQMNSSGAAIQYAVAVFFRVRKAVTPTLTKVGAAWSVSNCDQPAFGYPSQDGCMMTAASTGAGTLYARPGAATDYLTVEANP